MTDLRQPPPTPAPRGDAALRILLRWALENLHGIGWHGYPDSPCDCQKCTWARNAVAALASPAPSSAPPEPEGGATREPGGDPAGDPRRFGASSPGEPGEVSEAELAEWERLAEAATPGPLTAARLDKDGKPTFKTYVGWCIDAGKDDAGFYLVGTDEVDVCHTGNGPTSWANAQFIAAARTAVLRLVAAMRASRKGGQRD